MPSATRFKAVDQLIIDELTRDPSRTDNEIAKIAKCSHGAVRSRRRDGNFPAAIPKKKGVDPDRLNMNKQIRALLITRPDMSSTDIAREVGCSLGTVAANRKRWLASTKESQSPKEDAPTATRRTE
jgi:hypothetical protein